MQLLESPLTSRGDFCGVSVFVKNEDGSVTSNSKSGSKNSNEECGDVESICLASPTCSIGQSEASVAIQEMHQYLDRINRASNAGPTIAVDVSSQLIEDESAFLAQQSLFRVPTTNGVALHALVVKNSTDVQRCASLVLHSTTNMAKAASPIASRKSLTRMAKLDKTVQSVVFWIATTSLSNNSSLPYSIPLLEDCMHVLSNFNAAAFSPFHENSKLFTNYLLASTLLLDDEERKSGDVGDKENTSRIDISLHNKRSYLRNRGIYRHKNNTTKSFKQGVGNLGEPSGQFSASPCSAHAARISTERLQILSFSEKDVKLQKYTNKDSDLSNTSKTASIRRASRRRKAPTKKNSYLEFFDYKPQRQQVRTPTSATALSTPSQKHRPVKQHAPVQTSQGQSNTKRPQLRAPGKDTPASAKKNGGIPTISAPSNDSFPFRNSPSNAATPLNSKRWSLRSPPGELQKAPQDISTFGITSNRTPSGTSGRGTASFDPFAPPEDEENSNLDYFSTLPNATGTESFPPGPSPLGNSTDGASDNFFNAPTSNTSPLFSTSTAMDAFTGQQQSSDQPFFSPMQPLSPGFSEPLSQENRNRNGGGDNVVVTVDSSSKKSERQQALQALQPPSATSPTRQANGYISQDIPSASQNILDELQKDEQHLRSIISRDGSIFSSSSISALNDTVKDDEQPLQRILVNIALNEDLTCSYKQSKISSCSIEGVVQIQVKSENDSVVPFSLLLRDPSRHIRAIQENKRYANDITKKENTSEDSAEAADYRFTVSCPKADSYFPVMRYKCGGELRPVPIRVQTRVRIQKSTCRIALQISSNPANEDDLMDLMIIMGVDTTSVKGESLVTQPAGGVWNASKESVIWCVSELGEGEKFQLQAQFELRENYVADEKPKFPVLVRCQCMHKQLSDIELEVSDLPEIFPAEVTMKLARRFRLSHRERS